MSDAIVAMIGESYFVLVPEDSLGIQYLGIAECSSQEQAHNICVALNENGRLNDQFISYGGSE